MPTFFKAVRTVDDISQWTRNNKTRLKVGTIYLLFMLTGVVFSQLEQMQNDMYGYIKPATDLQEAASTVALTVASDAAMRVYNKFK